MAKTFSRERRKAILGGLALAASGTVWSNSSKAKTENFIAVMDFLPTWKQAAFHLAKVKGWYTSAGLDVEINDGSGSTVTIAQAASGKCDIGLASLSAMAVARGKGSDVIAVGEILAKNDIGMLVDKKLGITNPKQLAEKQAKIFFETTSYQSLFPAFFKNLGIDTTQVSLIPMSPASAIGTYVAGQGDALITTVPYVLPVVDKKRPSDVLLFADYGLPLPSHGLVVNPELLRSNPEKYRQFLSVTQRAWTEMWNSNGTDAIAALVDQRPLAKIDASLELKRLNAYRPFAVSEATRWHGALWMAPSEWDIAIKIMSDADLIPKDSKAANFFTNDFLPS
jgi:NitT/TauT family transport system substrate-binding protein